MMFKNIETKISKFSDLKIGDTIKLLVLQETFTIDNIYQDENEVDMTSTNPNDLTHNYYNIKLLNFEIISL